MSKDKELKPEDLLKNAKFGLAAQGHIEEIENYLDRGERFSAIAGYIGWDEETMLEHYIAHLRRELFNLKKPSPSIKQWIEENRGFEDLNGNLVKSVAGEYVEVSDLLPILAQWEDDKKREAVLEAADSAYDQLLDIYESKYHSIILDFRAKLRELANKQNVN